MHNLLSLLRLPSRCTKGKEPLIDYLQSHIVISSEYLDILKKKGMEKAIIEEIKEGKQKEKNDPNKQQNWVLQQIKQFENVHRNMLKQNSL